MNTMTRTAALGAGILAMLLSAAAPARGETVSELLRLADEDMRSLRLTTGGDCWRPWLTSSTKRS